MKRTYIITLLFSLCSLFMYAQDSRFDKFADMEEVTSVYISKAMLSLMPDMQTEGVKINLFRLRITNNLFMLSKKNIVNLNNLKITLIKGCVRNLVVVVLD